MTQYVEPPVQLAPPAVFVVAELAVLRALEAAGKRARLSHPDMAAARRFPTHEVHVHFPLAERARGCDRLFSGVWDHLQLVLPNPFAEQLAGACDAYVRDRVMRQRPHSRDVLRAALADLLAG